VDKINYLEILKRAWAITWGNKFLWWFGLLISFGFPNLSYNYNIPLNNYKKGSDIDAGKEVIGKAMGFAVSHYKIITAVLIALIILAVFFLIIGILARGGLIKTIHDIDNKRKKSFREGFKEGKRYFWRLLFSGLLVNIFLIGTGIILFLPVIFLFYMKSFLLGFVTLFLAIIIFLPLLIISSFLKNYSSMYIVLGDLKILSSLENAYALFRKNIFSSIIMALLFIPIGIAIGVALFFISLSFLAGLLLAGFVMHLFLNKAGIFIIASLGIAVFLLMFLLISAVYKVFCQSAWILFFKEIAKSEKKEEVVEEALSDKKIPEPEGIKMDG